MANGATIDDHVETDNREEPVVIAELVPEPVIRSFYDAETFTVTHLVSDPLSRRAAVIDSGARLRAQVRPDFARRR